MERFRYSQEDKRKIECMIHKLMSRNPSSEGVSSKIQESGGMTENVCTENTRSSMNGNTEGFRYSQEDKGEVECMIHKLMSRKPSSEGVSSKIQESGGRVPPFLL
ncbi:hypothetical protein CEXT_599751 [Caerostris extrusa]|uniref:Period n=1 Tax=Caerostris extrusa TaxID=172846 RepID=A0AAV4RN70_CAEEX|nr:hypothetical protein CEXT_599751 [Caerostris extrusa]